MPLTLVYLDARWLDAFGVQHGLDYSLTAIAVRHDADWLTILGCIQAEVVNRFKGPLSEIEWSVRQYELVGS